MVTETGVVPTVVCPIGLAIAGLTEMKWYNFSYESVDINIIQKRNIPITVTFIQYLFMKCKSATYLHCNSTMLSSEHNNWDYAE